MGASGLTLVAARLVLAGVIGVGMQEQSPVPATAGARCGSEAAAPGHVPVKSAAETLADDWAGDRGVRARSAPSAVSPPDLNVQVDLEREEARIAERTGCDVSHTPETMPSYVTMLWDVDRLEAAIAEAKLALTMFPGDVNVVAKCAPIAARCYAQLGREEAAIHYLEGVAAEYASDARIVPQRDLPLNKWLALNVVTLKMWTARRKGDYDAAARLCGEVADAAAQLLADRTSDVKAAFSVGDLYVTEGKLWEAAGDLVRAEAAYGRALAFIERNAPPDGEKTDIKMQRYDSWRAELPLRIVRCRQPLAADSLEALLARVDWLVEEGNWQLHDGRDYDTAGRNFAEALDILEWLDLAVLQAEASSRYLSLREEQLPSLMRQSQEMEEHRLEMRAEYESR
jgi:tetratricopeptide (TPR) repeat protein